MAYTKHTFNTGDILTKEILTNMDTQIYNNDTKITANATNITTNAANIKTNTNKLATIQIATDDQALELLYQ